MTDLIVVDYTQHAQTLDLPHLASLANETHDRAMTHANTAVSYAIQCGKILLQAKAKCQHGEWLPWLKANVRFHANSATGYMRLALNQQRVVDLPTLREALAHLAADPEPEPETADLLAAPPAEKPAPVVEKPREPGLTREQLREEGREIKRARQEREKTDPEWIAWKAWAPVLTPALLFSEGIDNLSANLPPLPDYDRAKLMAALRKIAAFIETFETVNFGEQS